MCVCVRAHYYHHHHTAGVTEEMAAVPLQSGFRKTFLNKKDSSNSDLLYMGCSVSIKYHQIFHKSSTCGATLLIRNIYWSRVGNVLGMHSRNWNASYTPYVATATVTAVLSGWFAWQSARQTAVSHERHCSIGPFCTEVQACHSAALWLSLVTGAWTDRV